LTAGASGDECSDPPHPDAVCETKSPVSWLAAEKNAVILDLRTEKPSIAIIWPGGESFLNALPARYQELPWIASSSSLMRMEQPRCWQAVI